MVSVVTGSGVGLVNSSRDVLGGAGVLGNASTGRAGEHISVNAANGNLVVQDRDEYLVGSGPDVDLLRTYNSQRSVADWNAWDGDNDDNWRIGYYRRIWKQAGSINVDGSTVLRTNADGHDTLYTYSAAAGCYLAHEGPGQLDRLTYSAGSWTWTDSDTGVAETYTSVDNGLTYRLNRVQTSEGHSVVVGYTGSLITSLSTFKDGASTADEVVNLTYVGTQLTQISTNYQDAQGQLKTRSLTSYQYTNGRLSQVTTDLSPEDGSIADGNTYTVSYRYDTNGRLQNITQKDGSQISINYDATGRVESIYDEQNRRTGFVYDQANRVTTVTDALNQATTLKYDSGGKLLEVAGAVTGGTAFMQSYSYDSTSGELLTSTYGANQSVAYRYEGGNGTWTRRTDGAGNVVERSYDPSTHLLVSETTYSGTGTVGPRKTQYFYDTSGGHRRLAYVLGPQGQVTRYTYDLLGRLQRQLQYTTAAYLEANPSLASLQAWANGPQALTLDRQVTEYSYDLRGKVQEERHYASASLSNGTIVDTGLTKTTYVYDAFGRLISRLDNDGYGPTYSYDGLNRVTQIIDARNTVTGTSAVTRYTYDDAGRKTSVKLDNGQTTVQLFDTRGNLISSDVMGVGNTPANPKLLGATQYAYDAVGRLWRTTDATGVSTYTLYDVSGRKSASVAANGQLTEYFYDAAGRLIQSIAYSSTVATSNITAASTVVDKLLINKPLVSITRPDPDVANDRITTYYYDDAGRLTGTLDADGYLVENQYDGTSALLKQIRYATAQAVTRVDVTRGSTQANTLGLTRPAGSPGDRVTRNLYNASGQLAARIDGEGSLTLWTYDLAGNALSQLRRSVFLSDTQRSGASLAELEALAPLADDELTQWVYDSAGRQIAQLDAEGFLTEYKYEASGRPSDTLRYLTQAFKPVVGTGPSPLHLLKRSDLDTLRPTLGTPLKTSRSYNSRGLLETETAADGTVTFYTYDNLQRLQSVTQAKGAVDSTGNSLERAQSTTYDDWGRLRVTQTVGDATGTTTTYDAAGRRISVKDTRGNTTYFYYDAQGRQVYAILKDLITGGEVTETLYSSFSEVKTTVTYKNRLNLASALTGGQVSADLAANVAALADASDNRTNLSYNRRGLIQQAIDALGYKTDSSYNAFGQLATATSDVDALGTPNSRRVSTTTSYDRRGLAIQISRSGNGLSAPVSTNAGYDALGRLSQTLDELNQSTTYAYTRNSGNGRKLVVSGPAGNVTTTYDALSRALTRQERNGHTVTYAYDDLNRTFTVRTAEGIQTTTEANRFGQTIRVTDDNQATTTYAYDRHGWLLSITDALGNVTLNDYDAGGNLTRLVQGLKANGTGAPSNDGSAIATSYSYDAANRVLTQTVDPGGIALQTRYQYDGQGRRLQIIDPRGTVTTQSFTAKGELKDVIVDDAAQGLQLKTSYGYDAQSRVLTVIEGAGTPAARKTAYEYDVLGRRTAETLDPDKLKLKTRFEYDAAGHLVLQRNALNQVSARYVYDNAGRLKYSIDATGAVVLNSYDGEGHLTSSQAYSTRLAAGWDTQTEVDLRTTLATLATNAADQQTLHTYDKDGRRTFTVNGAGEATQFIYDKVGRVIETVRFATRLAGYTAASDFVALTQAIASSQDLHNLSTYDAIGRVRYTTDATGAVTEFAYDRAGHVTRQKRYANLLTLPVSQPIAPPAGSNIDRVTDFAYDAAGRQRFMVDAEGYVTETRYDDLNGLTTTLRYINRLSGASSYAPAASPLAQAGFTPAILTALGSSNSVSRGLDRAGRLSTRTDGNGVTQLTTYDAAGRVQTEVAASGRPEQSTTYYKYNSAGQLTELTRGYGTTAVSTTRYEYDSLGRLWRTIDPRGVALAQRTGVWAATELGRLPPASQTPSAVLAAYTTETQYDAAGRVIKVIDPLGGVTATQYDAFGNAIQITDARGYSRYQVFDNAGRLVQSVDAERYLTHYSYDTFGNLQSHTCVDARVQGDITAGQAVQLLGTAPTSGAYVLTNAALDHGTSRTYDHNNRLLTETDAENYTEGAVGALDAFGQQLSVKNKLGAVVSYSYDRLGRLISETLPVLAKDANGVLKAVINAYEYDAYGNRIKSIEAVGLPEQRTTQMRYDGAGRLTLRIGMVYSAMTASDGSTASVTPADFYRYDGLGNVIEHIQHGQLQADGGTVSGGQRTLARYDALSRKVVIVSADRVISTSSYDPAGNQVTLTTSAKRIAETAVLTPDTLPSLIIEVTPDWANDRTLHFRYDALGRKIETSLDNVYIWDNALPNQAVNDLQPQQNVVLQQSFYDATGNITESRDGRGNASFAYYDGLGRRVLSIDAGGAAIAWDYGRAGNVATGETRFSAMLQGANGRQANTLALSGSSNSPDALRSLYDSLQRNRAEDRVTTYRLDRLDRVLEKRILNVAQDFVDASGTRTQSTGTFNNPNLDAITQYQYNGLGSVTQVRELAAQVGGTQHWEQTDLQYDSLNREIGRKSPQFQDFEGAMVRPTVDTEYDGLGQVLRRIQRGKDNSAETDDRITVNKYDANGRLIQVTDAAQAVTRYTYDVNGNLARRINVGVHRSDNSSRDLIKAYQYDAIGRLTVQTDIDTGEVRKTRYNAFGEIEAQGLGDGWEEFAEYTTLGKVSKTNSGDGALKFYLYDACGNLTREIMGAYYNPAMTLAEASNTIGLAYSRLSYYNSRNQLVKTVDPQMNLLRDAGGLAQLYTSQWVSAWTPGADLVRSATTVSTASAVAISGSTPMVTFSMPGAKYIASNVYFALGGATEMFGVEPSSTGNFTYNLSNCKGRGPLSFAMTFTDVATSGADPVGYVSGTCTVDNNGVVTLNVSTETLTIPARIDWPNVGAASYAFTLVNADSGQVLTTATDYIWEPPYGASRGARLVIPDSLRPTPPTDPSAPPNVRLIDIQYSVQAGANPTTTAALRVSLDSLGQLSLVSQGSGLTPGQVVLYIKGRNVPKAELTVDGNKFQLLGTYFPATQTDFAYTRFTLEGRFLDGTKDMHDFSLAAQDAGGASMLDEFGTKLVQTGRIDMSARNIPPRVLKQLGYILVDNKVTVTRLQDFNAFGDVCEERDDRVAERMLAALNDDRLLKGQPALTALSAEQLAAARTTLQYNVLGQLVAKIDPETFVTAANGYRYRARPITRYGYDLLGRHTTTTDANGNLSRASYGAGTRAQSRSGEAMAAFEFDAMGGTADAYLAGVINGVVYGGIKQIQRDIFGNARRVIDAELHVSEQEFDRMDRLITVTRKGVVRYQADGSALASVDLTDRYVYDELGQRLLSRNALLYDTTTDYDGLGRIVKTISAQGATTTYAYQQYTASQQSIYNMAGYTSGKYSGGYVKTTTQADGRWSRDDVEYFGHTMRHEDLGGAVTLNLYDGGARLITQYVGAGAVLNYEYYANGYLSRLSDRGRLGSSYWYDNAGNRVGESYFNVDTFGREAAAFVDGINQSTDPQNIRQNNAIVYDELNRIVRVYDPQPDGRAGRLDIHYEYDAMGNRRLVDSVYYDGAAGLLDRQTYWYAYDAMNRFVVTKGQLSSTTAASGDANIDRNRFYNAPRGTDLNDQSISVVAGSGDGVTIGYDRISQRVRATYTYSNAQVAETYTYSSDGYLQLTRQGNVLKTSRDLDELGRTTTLHDLSGNNAQHTSSFYDRDNRVLSQTFTDNGDSSRNYTLSYLYYDTPPAGSLHAKQTAKNNVLTFSANGRGALAQTVLHPNATNGSDTVTTYTYLYLDQALQSKIVKVAPGTASTTTTFSYDSLGHLTGALDSASLIYNAYTTTANGLVLKRERSNTADSSARHTNHFFFYADDHRVGDVSDTPDDIYRVSYAEQLAAKASGNRRSYYRATPGVGTGSASTADFDQNYEPINDDYPGAAGLGYTVGSDSETLASIAQQLWGDRSMWYLIAEANGMRYDSLLKAGQRLIIPNKVTNIHNNASTWRPYNAGEAIGATAPTLPRAEIESSYGDSGSDYDYDGDRSGDYAWINTWDNYHDSLSHWISGGGYAPPASPNNITYGTGLQALANSSWVPRITPNYDVGPTWASAGSLAARKERARATNPYALPTQRLGKDGGRSIVRLGLGTEQWDWTSVAESALGSAIGDSIASPVTQGQGPWSSADYRNGSDIESDNFNPASAYGYRNGMDVESDAFRPAMAYGYRNGSDVESDNMMAARELANNRTMLNAAERAARPEAYMSIERLPRVVVTSQRRTVTMLDEGALSGSSFDTARASRTAFPENQSWNLGRGGRLEPNMAWVGPNGETNVVPLIAPSAVSQKLSSLGVASRDLGMASTSWSEAARGAGGRMFNWLVQGGSASALTEPGSMSLDPSIRAELRSLATGDGPYVPRTDAERGGYGALVSVPAFGLEMWGAIEGVRGLSAFGDARVAGRLGAADAAVASTRMDLSAEFSVSKTPQGVRLQYGDPNGWAAAGGDSHGIVGFVDKEGILGVDVYANPALRAQYGSGTDMYNSMMTRLRQEGVDVAGIRGAWLKGTDSVNFAQYQSGLAAGLEPTQAALNTWTGKLAQSYGYSRVESITGGSSNVYVVFRKQPGS